MNNKKDYAVVDENDDDVDDDDNDNDNIYNDEKMRKVKKNELK